MKHSILSAKITLYSTYFFYALLLAMMIFAYPILKWFYAFSGDPTSIFKIMIPFYICCPAAVVALTQITLLMKNIIKGEIFIMKNVTYMRVLSWCCFFVGIVCLISGIRYFPLWIFALGASFMCLILRVLKNVMEKATEIKNENELTI